MITHSCPVVLLWVVATAGCAQPRPHAAPPETFAIAGARVYPSPTDPAINDAVVIVQDGRIVAIGPRQRTEPPPGAHVIDGRGKILTAGYWNSHVHFIEQHWRQSGSAAAADLTAHLQRMLVRHGFTSVVDAGSYWHVTQALRSRIESGEVAGPRILTAGEILFPKDGAPPPDFFEAVGAIVGTMPEIGTPEEAVALTRAKCDQGADVVKLYMATWWQRPAARLTPATVQAVVTEARRHGRLVLAHPSDLVGLETAIAGGVDVIMHTTAPAGPWPDGLAKRLREHGIALVPTLKLWRAELLREGVPEATAAEIQQTAVGQLRAFVAAGGEVLFGTDVGYLQDDDPQEEYVLMAAAGMSGRQILASLTTAPAARFGGTGHIGTIAPGEPADLVLLDGDPVEDPAAFGRVTLVVRSGRMISESGREWPNAAGRP
jgi:imidazolonepropionase-like amidohydrolase